MQNGGINMATYAKIANGIVVNVQLLDPEDPQDPSFIWDNIDAKACQDGAPIQIGCKFSGGIYTNIAPPPSVPLNQQYSKSDFGQMLLAQFTQLNGTRNLTSDQLMQIAVNFAPFFILLHTGALQTFLDEIEKIPVDGVLVTSDMISMLEQPIQAYLAGM